MPPPIYAGTLRRTSKSGSFFSESAARGGKKGRCYNARRYGSRTLAANRAALSFGAAARTAADAASPPRYDRAAYEQWHRAQFGISVYDDPDFSRRLDPTRRGRAAEVSRAMTLFRDRHIYTHIMRVLGTYRRTLRGFVRVTNERSARRLRVLGESPDTSRATLPVHES